MRAQRGEEHYEGDFAHLETHVPESRTKPRIFRIRSLDQMVNDTEQLTRADNSGDSKSWVLHLGKVLMRVAPFDAGVRRTG